MSDELGLTLIFVYILHGKDKLTMEWLPWLQTSWRDSGYPRYVLYSYFADYIRQPERKHVLPWLSYNKDFLQLPTTTSVRDHQLLSKE